MLESSGVIPLVALAVGFLCLYEFVLYPACLSPLCRLPNAHWSSPFSSLWINHIRYRMRENHAIFHAHKLYGPIVRLGPKEVSVNSVDDGVRTVYGTGYEKGEWYAIFNNYG